MRQRLIRLYIPTLGRVEKQITWDLLPAGLRRTATLVCPPSEVKAHQQQGRRAIPCRVSGIARVRKWIIDRARNKNFPYIGVLDDDITGFVYTAPPSQHVEGVPWNRSIRDDGFELEIEHWKSMWSWLRRTLETTALCGFADANYYPIENDITVGARQLRNHFFNLDLVPANGIDWTSVRYAEDFHVILQLIGHGLPNHRNNRYRFTATATQTSGGCSMEGRDRDAHNEAMLRLIQLHEPWVRRSTRHVRQGAEDWIKVVIRWQAYKKYVENQNG